MAATFLLLEKDVLNHWFIIMKLYRKVQGMIGEPFWRTQTNSFFAKRSSVYRYRESF